MLQIENRLGRVRIEHWGPRVIDLDLLVYGKVKMKTPLLTIPHPRLKERAFVLFPLNDIAPGLVIPGSGKSVASLKDALPETTGVDLYPEALR